MLYDEPDLGSGDIFEGDANEDTMNIPFVQEKEDEEVQENNTIIDDKLPEDDFLATQPSEDSLDETLEEGSGDEGSGFGTGIIGCIENCSTPGPVGANDEEHASPLPSAIDQTKIILDDINLFKEDVITTTTTTPTTTTPTTTTTTEITTTTTSVPIVEPKVLKKVQTNIDTPLAKNGDVELFETGTTTGELERASAVPKNSTAVYAIVGVGLFLAVVFTICFIKNHKARKRTNRRHDIPNLGEEMKPLNKTSINEKPLRNSSNIPEHIPLINGQNGKPKDDAPVLKTFTTLAHPETVHEEEEEPEQEYIQNDIPEVEVRQKSVPELLTPQRERVTIIETEIPDSIPKTPLLVHRQRNSDGEIVTTLVP
ncbi:hypothetical protein NQ314_010809 [Rhamnusium bicolor]|uniref:Uncharacterized protein n=1 Tax=Rhamnusium bicolor TaxID=1586634 RepID=A0AAV8XP02_9CUCU|nr:hypothetical protein NQ314_010809 [Rhamnusium bicolor]